MEKLNKTRCPNTAQNKSDSESGFTAMEGRGHKIKCLAEKARNINEAKYFTKRVIFS